MEEKRVRLQPRSLGELLDDNFRLYREKFRFLIISGICLLLPYHILFAYVTSRYNLPDFQSQLKQIQTGTMVSTPPPESLTQIITPGFIWIEALGFINALLVMPLLYGMIIHMITKHYLNREDVSLGDASAHAFRRLLPNILTIVFLSVVSIIVFVIAALAVAMLYATSKVAAVFVGVLAFFVLMCLIVWLLVRLSLIQSVIIEEKRMMFRAIARSWVLSRQNFWRLLGYFVLMFIIVGVFRAAILIAVNAFINQPALLAIMNTVVDALTLPIFIVSYVNIYVDLRIRKDGLDLIEE